MRNHSPFLFQTNKQTKFNMKTTQEHITFIPNQQKSSFTNFRNIIVMNINNMINNENKTFKDKNKIIPNVSNDMIKNREELNQLIKETGLQTIGKSIIKKQLKK